MAVTGSFRQQCPSCEAMILIKDPKQVGKKFDCPNCKFRFVVDDPADKEEEVIEEAPPAAKPKAKSNTAVTAKKPAAPPPAPAAKKKAGPKKPVADDEEDDEDRPKKKKAQSGNMVVILGVGLAACALIVLGVGGYFLFFTGKDDGKFHASTGPKGGGPGPRGTGAQVSKKEGSNEPKLVEITNLIPAETQSLLNLNVENLVKGSLGRAAFETPGAFQKKFVSQKLGIPVDDIDQLLIAWNAAKGWTFAVVRTEKPLGEDFKKAANLEIPPPYKGQEYLLTQPSDWLDRVWAALMGLPVPDPKPRQLALRLVDPQTLVVTDSVQLLKEFMDEKGQPKQRSKPGGKTPGGQPASNRYLTVSPELKGLLDQLEAKPVLLSWAMETGSVRAELLPAIADRLKLFGLAIDDRLVMALGDLRALGLALQTKDQTMLTLGLDYRDHKPAQETQDVFRMKTDELAKTNLPGKGNLPPWFPVPFVVEIDGKVAIAPALLPLLPPPAPPPPIPPKIIVKSQVQVQTFLVTADIVLSPLANSLAIQNRLAPEMVRLHGAVEMATPQPRAHELASALLAMAQKDGKFPRGTFARPVEKDRRGRPYEPDDRVSWMIELLPYLDLADLRRQIKTDRSWRDMENAAAAACLVPAFLDATSPSSSWWTRSASQPARIFGTTQWVGMAGVGLDAADYAADDTSVAGKLGIFGYDRETKLDDLKDVRSNTIALIQVPAADVADKDIRSYRRPWLAGGGATVAGVPEKGSVKPFVCGQYEMGGAKVWGAFAIMADGTVRFIPETISDDAFKALCAIAGDKKKVDLAKDTVVVPPPGQAILKPKE